MREAEKYGLVLFKEYTMLQLKSFVVAYFTKHKGKAGGATEPFELDVLNEAINLHRTYNSMKLNKTNESLFKEMAS